jgi:tetratricopeptide (TPR) repeat protein
VGKTVGAVGRLLKPRRQELHGLAYAAEKRLVARLTARYFERSPRWNGRNRFSKQIYGLFDRFVEHTFTVTAIADNTLDDAAKAVAEEVTFKMLHVIAKGFPPSGADQAAELKRGLEELRAYVSGSAAAEGRQPWESLESARRIFASVRASPAESFETDLYAHLYEGIALDLLEDHEGAIGHFKYVKDAANAQRSRGAVAGNGPKDSGDQKILNDMYERGAYNEAIANLRNLYRYPGIKECITLVDDLTKGLDANDINAVKIRSPIQVLALAVKADAIGCWPIVWKAIAEKEMSIKKDDADLKVLKHIIAESDTKVSAITGVLRQVVNADKKDRHQDWDDHGIRQLEWAIHNAEGDLNLYSVVNLDLEIAKPGKDEKAKYLDVREIRLLAERGDKELLEIRKQRLQKAATAFHMCEQLLPPGVETLCNLGTLYLTRGGSHDLVQARSYFTRAIALNPNYEFAYYKLAQTWEMDQLREKVIETLKQLPKPPGISSFLTMYREYFVQPKSVSESIAKPTTANSPKTP